MIRFRTTIVALGLALTALFVTAGPALAAGSAYVTDPTATFVYTKNTWYYGGSMTAPSGTPATGITNLRWAFQTSYPVPTGHVEQICDITWGQCLDITGLGSGTSLAFNGRPATDTFQFRFAVTGTGTISGYYFTGKNITIFY
jgi:flagellar protein FlhE